MDPWLIWLIAAVIFAVGEIATLSFFLAVSGVLLGTLRPLARSHRRVPPQIRTGTAALVGRTGVAVDRISHEGGTIRLDGEVWTARPYDEDEVIEAGSRVSVVEIRGATALVTP